MCHLVSVPLISCPCLLLIDVTLSSIASIFVLFQAQVYAHYSYTVTSRSETNNLGSCTCTPTGMQDECRAKTCVGEAARLPNDRVAIDWVVLFLYLVVRMSTAVVSAGQYRGDLTQQALEIVHDNHAERTPMAISEHLADSRDLLRPGEPDHAVGQDRLDKWELQGLGDRRADRPLDDETEDWNDGAAETGVGMFGVEAREPEEPSVRLPTRRVGLCVAAPPHA
jgi:hypothetical protein